VDLQETQAQLGWKASVSRVAVTETIFNCPTEGGFMNYCVKLRKPQSGLMIVPFASHVERNDWLRDNGFYESSGIYRNLNGWTAGIFTKDLNQKNVAVNCDKPIQSRKGLLSPWMK
jgi:hypothetical protein